MPRAKTGFQVDVVRAGAVLPRKRAELTTISAKDQENYANGL